MSQSPTRASDALSLQSSKPVSRKQASDGWTWLSITSLISALGLAVLALADNAGRAALPQADTMFWSGLLLVFAPAAVRLVGKQASREERITLVAQMGMSLYLVKVLAYPTSLPMVDEWPHVRNTMNILDTGHLFQQLPLQHMAQWFPGLAIVTSAVSSLSGLPITTAGLIVIGAARLVLVFALFLFYERVARSAHVAGIATMIYMANPMFLFFDSSFIYESLGLAFASLVLMVISTFVGELRSRNVTARPIDCALVTILLAALAITHHMTSYLLALLLMLWALISWFSTRESTPRRWPITVAAIAALVNLGWLLVVGNAMYLYLRPFVIQISSQLQTVVAGHMQRQLFQDSARQMVPRWELAVSFGSVGLIMVGLLVGLFFIWRYHRRNGLIIALAIASLIYPVSLVIRLTPTGGIVGNRATGDMYVCLALVVALAVTDARIPVSKRFRSLLTPTMLTAALISAYIIVFIGGVIMNTPLSWQRLPGPFLVAADQRSRTPEGISAAEWMLQYVGPGHRIATDTGNRALMATYGDQNLGGTGWLLPIFGSPQYGRSQKYLIQAGQIDYLVVDHRISTGLSHTGGYFGDWDESNETVPGLWQGSPIPLSNLTKFDGVKGINRVLDSGDIVIYGTGAIEHGG